MFDKLMDKFISERNKMVDYCTQLLIEKAGIAVPINPTSFEMLMVMDDLKRKDYKIKIDHSYNDKTRIYLIKLEDLYENIQYGFELDVKTDDKKVSIVAIPIGNI